MELLNVCIYLRKSRADREAEARGEGETLARHERILLDLAKKRGYNVGAIYKEIVSGETISATAAALEACSAAIERLQEELERDRLILEQRSSFIPRCEDLLAHYWDLDIPTRNRILRELIDKVLYTKDTKNAFLEGDKITFLLDIFPKIQENI